MTSDATLKFDPDTGELLAAEIPPDYSVITLPEGETNLYKKKALIYTELQAISKDRKHEMGFKYSTVEAVAKEIRGLLGKHGLVFSPRMISMDRTTDPKRWLIAFDMRIICADTGMVEHSLWFQDAFPLTHRGNTDDKAMGKAESYACKYFLLKSFLMGADDDDDLDKDNRAGRSGNSDTQVNIATAVRRFKRGEHNVVEFTLQGSKPVNILLQYLPNVVAEHNDAEWTDQFMGLIDKVTGESPTKLSALMLPKLKIQHTADGKYRRIIGIKPLDDDGDYGKPDPEQETATESNTEQDDDEPEGDAPQWGTDESLNLMFQWLGHMIDPAITKREFAELAGIDPAKASDPLAWAVKYASGKDAMLAIRAEFNKPAESKNGKPESKEEPEDEPSEGDEPELLIFKGVKAKYTATPKGNKRVRLISPDGKAVTFYSRQFLRDVDGDQPGDWTKYVEGWEIDQLYDFTEDEMPILNLTFEGELKASNLKKITEEVVF